MARKWYSIAKAEYLVSTVSMKGKRTLSIAALTIFGVIWATILAPFIVNTILDIILPIELLRTIITSILPGLLRTIMFLIWMILLIVPLSRALQEIKIGQWEIFLSNNVKTRDILIGTFLGKIPLYGLLVLYLAPPFMAILFITFEVSLVGQILSYLTLFVMILTTIWLANLITALIQAKLGESSRGKELANGLAILLAIVTIIPLYGVMFFSPQLSIILGLNVFLLLPFTWPADITSWLIILTSQIGFSLEQILAFQHILQFDIIISVAVLSLFTIVSVGIGLAAADRVFTYNIGARTEQITTVSQENFILRGIRKTIPGSFGTLVVICFKDFFRKASNLSKIAYGIILAVVIPFITTQMSLAMGSELDIMMIILSGGIGMALIGAFTFSGTSFMESKDQLWIIQSTPSGTSRYVKARVVTAIITAIPLTILPALIMTILVTGGIDVFLLLLIYGYTVICGAILFSTGVTALNPHYENTKSPEHQMNVIVGTMGVQFTLIGPIFVILFSDIFGFPIYDIIRNIFGPIGIPMVFSITGTLTLLIIGSITLGVGIRRLGQPEK